MFVRKNIVFILYLSLMWICTHIHQQAYKDRCKCRNVRTYLVVVSRLLSRVSTAMLTRDTDIAIMSVRLSVCHVPELHRNGSTYHHTFLVTPSFQFSNTKHICEIPTRSSPIHALNTGGVAFRNVASFCQIGSVTNVFCPVQNYPVKFMLAATAGATTGVPYVSSLVKNFPMSRTFTVPADLRLHVQWRMIQGVRGHSPPSQTHEKCYPTTLLRGLSKS